MVNVGDYLRIKVSGSCFNQAVNNVFDYRASGAANEGTVFLDIFRQEWRRWICNLLSNYYQVASYSLQCYDRLEYTPPVISLDAPKPAKLKIWFTEQARLDGESRDVGAQNANPLPSYVAVSAHKTVSGTCTQWTGRGEAEIVNADTRIKGSTRFGPLTEDQTRDTQGNELADSLLSSINPLNVFTPFATNRANWLSGWRHACEQMRHITTQATLGGTSSTMEMQVCSLYGVNHNIRVSSSGTPPVYTPKILFSPVTAFGVSRYVGRQSTRQQREKFQ